ncbi:MAG: hypothetical protein SGPRY_002326, partial [Prymnesium sp.]
RGRSLAAFFEGVVSRKERKGSLAAVSTMHTALLCAPEAAILMQPTLQAMLAEEAGGGKGRSVRELVSLNKADGSNELFMAALASLIGRAVVSAPHVISAAIAAESSRSQQLVSQWLEVSDSIVLSLQRKITALAFGTLLTLDSSLLPLLGEMLSFCVSVLAELEPPQPDAQPLRPVGRARSGDHAAFAERLEAHSLDPLASLPLRPALQECMSRVAALHGDNLQRQLLAMDVDLLQQVKQAFDGVNHQSI